MERVLFPIFRFIVPSIQKHTHWTHRQPDMSLKLSCIITTNSSDPCDSGSNQSFALVYNEATSSSLLITGYSV